MSFTLTRWNRVEAAFCCGLLMIFLAWSLLPGQYVHLKRQRPLAVGSGSYNETLGFGAIFVLTEDPTSWRVQGLLEAAELTGLHLQIAKQDHRDDEAVRAHLGEGAKQELPSTRALLNHLALLEVIAQSDHETALVLEDDVDFSIRIKIQMNALSAAIWNRSGNFWTETERNLDPYRNAELDILWLGHYCMQFISGSDIFRYNDPDALPWSRLTSTFNDYYDQMAAEDPPSSQQVVFNVGPLATFAYATTRTHAAHLVQRLLVDGVHLKQGLGFDEALHIDCVGWEQRCVAPVPGLFHHHKVIGESSIRDAGDGEKQDMSWYHKKHKFTWNIEYSSRCNAAQVGEKLGDKWQCLPNFDDEFH